MPMYNYKCEKCDHDFDAVRSISQRDAPTNDPCPSCGETGGVIKVLVSATIVAGVGDFRSKVPGVFRERLQQIKSQSGKGCTIET